jgi:arylsulfatase
MDQWKGLRMNIMEGNLEIELFNLEQDPREQQDLADQHPEIVRQMEQIMKSAHTTAELEVFRMEVLETN